MRYSAVIGFYLWVILCGMTPSNLLAVAELQPHRAYYTISMENRPNLHTNITDIRGMMMVEYNKVSGGWTVQQLSEIWRYYDDETVEHVRWGYVTFEADDESIFKFRTFRKVNDELQEDIRGVAKRTGKLVEVLYQSPHKTKISLPEGVLFPLQHIRELLKAAEDGEHMFPRVVFDGSSTDGASEINTFIGAKKVLDEKSDKGSFHQFLGQPFWSVRFAVYGVGKSDYEPDYITTQDISTNGIFKQYSINDGAVVIQGILERLELLNKDGY